MKFDNVSPIVAAARRVELPLGPATVGFLVTYCDPKSPQYMKVRSEVSKPVRKLIEVDALPPIKDREIAVTTFVKACLTGWDGITSDGEDVPYSETAAIDLLTQAPTLFYQLVNEAMDTGNFKPGEGDAKN